MPGRVFLSQDGNVSNPEQEQAWLNQALAGNQQAFGRLVEVYQAPVSTWPTACWAIQEKPKKPRRTRF